MTELSFTSNDDTKDKELVEPVSPLRVAANLSTSDAELPGLTLINLIASLPYNFVFGA